MHKYFSGEGTKLTFQRSIKLTCSKYISGSLEKKKLTDMEYHEKEAKKFQYRL